MKRFVAIAAILAIAGALIWFATRDREGSGGVPPPAEPAPPLAESPDSNLREDLSSQYLRGYGNEAGDPARDLVLVKDVLDAFLYTVKVSGALPTSGNREIMTVLTGDNPHRIRFLDPAFDFLNADGELEDRWGTPLYFHFVESTDPAIRSAGPDRTMWTADDVVNGEYAGEVK